MKLLIVGGVAGGASAAARARRLSEDANSPATGKLQPCQIWQRGYLAGDDTSAFYPLWPVLLRAASSVSGGKMRNDSGNRRKIRR